MEEAKCLHTLGLNKPCQFCRCQNLDLQVETHFKVFYYKVTSCEGMRRASLKHSFFTKVNGNQPTLCANISKLLTAHTHLYNPRFSTQAALSLLFKKTSPYFTEGEQTHLTPNFHAGQGWNLLRTNQPGWPLASGAGML